MKKKRFVLLVALVVAVLMLSTATALAAPDAASNTDVQWADRDRGILVMTWTNPDVGEPAESAFIQSELVSTMTADAPGTAFDRTDCAGTDTSALFTKTLVPGIYRFVVVRVSASGNTTSAPAFVPFKVGTTTIEGSPHSAETWFRTDASFTLAATPFSEDSPLAGMFYRYSLSDTAIPYADPVTVSSEGVTRVYYNSVSWIDQDTMYYMVEPVHIAEFRIDQHAPIVTSDANSSYAGTATIALTAIDSTVATTSVSGVEHVEYNLDGSGWTSGTVVSTNLVGSHTLSARASDLAGNEASLPTVNFTVTAPLPPAPTVYATKAAITCGKTVKRGKTLTVTTIMSPRAAGGTVKLTVQYKKGKKWVTAKKVSVRLAYGKTVYKYKVAKKARKGSWRVSASYGGQTTSTAIYGPSSASRSFKVK